MTEGNAMAKKTINQTKPLECWAPIDEDGKIIVGGALEAKKKPTTNDCAVWSDTADFVRVRITPIKPKAKRK